MQIVIVSLSVGVAQKVMVLGTVISWEQLSVGNSSPLAIVILH